MTAVGAFFFLGAPFMTVLVGGFLALKSVDIAGNAVDAIRKRRMSAKVSVDKEVIQKNIAVHKENTNKKFFDEKTGQWNLKALPLDMYPSVGLKSELAEFTCAGVPGVVEGKFLGSRFGKQNVEFSMVIDDATKAENMSNFIAENGLIGTEVHRSQDGRFIIVSDNAVDINTLVKEFYPPKTMEVEREIRTTRQYRVSGCKSYEDALEKFRENRFSYSPENIFVSYQDTVDGVADHPFVSGNAIDTSSMQVGEYIINETSWEVYSRNLTVNGGIDCTEDAMRSIASDMIGKPGNPGPIKLTKENDLVEDKCSAEPVLANGMSGKKTERYILYEGESVKIPEDRNAEPDIRSSIVLRFKSLDELRSVASGNESIQGHVVLLEDDSKIPVARDGEFVLTVPADRQVMESLKLRNGDPEAVAEKYSGTGLTVQQIQAACVEGEIQKNGYVSAELVDNIDFSRSKVNGVPISELNDRIDNMVENNVVDQLQSREQAQQWLRDAAKIQSIHMDLDLKNQQLVVTSTVGTPEVNETKVETRPLNEDEIRFMSARGVVSNAEMKDILMMCHPGFFETYHVPGTKESGLYHDPLGAFVRGEKPRLAFDVKKEIEEKKKAERQEQKSQQNHSKIVKKQNKI